eukprot:gene5611-6980_t
MIGLGGWPLPGRRGAPARVDGATAGQNVFTRGLIDANFLIGVGVAMMLMFANPLKGYTFGFGGGK